MSKKEKFKLSINDNYIVSCRAKDMYDPVVSSMQCIALLLDYLSEEEAPISIINVLLDLAEDIGVKVKLTPFKKQ